MAQLTPEQTEQYYASQGNAPNPLSPLDWLSQQNQPASGAIAPPVTTTPPPAPQAPAPMTMQGTTPTATQPSATAPQTLQMPASGSVVDLLNMAGVDSSSQNRAVLAKQFGIEGYSTKGGTAAQNQELAKKFMAAFNATGSIPTPETSAAGRSGVNDMMEQTAPKDEEDVQANFFDAYGSMNPVEKSLYDAINTAISTPVTKTSLVEEYQKLLTEQGVPALRTDLLNIKKIMNGTEDDIRDEITKAGGFATESQVAALTGARNKTLLKQATNLADQLAIQEDYVDQLMNFTKLDREEVEKQTDKKLGLREKLVTMQQKMQENAKKNYETIVNKIGFSGLAELFKADPSSMKRAEDILGLPKGALTNENFLNSEMVKSGPTSVQEYEYAKKNGYTGTYEQYQNEDANRKMRIAAAGVGGTGMSVQQYNTLDRITRDFNDDKIVLNAAKAAQLKTISDQIIANPGKATNQLKSLYSLIKALDADSAVREGELELAAGAASRWENAQKAITRIGTGQIIAPAVAKEMAEATKELAEAWEQQARSRQRTYQARANVAAVGDQFNEFVAMSDFDFNKTDQYAEHRASLKPGEILIARDGQIGAIEESELRAHDIRL